MKRVLLLFILAPALARADSDFDRRRFAIFAGGGLSIGQNSFNLPVSNANSDFLAQGYLAEAGISLPLTSRAGLELSAAYGQAAGANSANNQKSIETGAIKQYGAKAGIFIGPLTFGGGMQVVDVNVKSIAIPQPGFQESRFQGAVPFGFANVTVNFGSAMRGAIEASYASGALANQNADSSAASVNISQISLYLKTYFVFH